MKILIIEDDPAMRGALFQMINNIGKHDISLISDGHNAVSLLADPAHNFDLVFIDLRMPRLTGDKVIEIIQDISQVHFVALTAHLSDFPKLPKHIRVIEKPFDYETIEEAIREREQTLQSQSKALPNHPPSMLKSPSSANRQPPAP
ncbi:MAG: response regulator [Verrucomicrobiae bacterium]|nr:response regulator [Verrucomicrobiae bacterium]